MFVFASHLHMPCLRECGYVFTSSAICLFAFCHEIQIYDADYSLYTWPSAVVLAQYIWHHWHDFQGRTVLEVSKQVFLSRPSSFSLFSHRVSVTYKWKEAKTGGKEETKERVCNAFLCLSFWPFSPFGPPVLWPYSLTVFAVPHFFTRSLLTKVGMWYIFARTDSRKIGF